MWKLAVKLNEFLGYPSFYIKKPFFFNAENTKQMGWAKVIKKLDRKNLTVLETGRIRNPNWKNSDGNSTYFFSRIDRIDHFISIDNDSENASGFSTSEEYCKKYLNDHQLKKIQFINGDSKAEIARLSKDKTILDIALLDSANDPDLVLEELKAVIPYMNKKGAIIIIDDVRDNGKKGDKAIPYMINLGYKANYIVAKPNDCVYFEI